MTIFILFKRRFCNRMFIPKKPKQRPMKIQTSVATPTTNPAAKLLKSMGQIASSIKNTLSEAVQPPRGGRY